MKAPGCHSHIAKVPGFLISFWVSRGAPIVRLMMSMESQFFLVEPMITGSLAGRCASHHEAALGVLNQGPGWRTRQDPQQMAGATLRAGFTSGGQYALYLVSGRGATAGVYAESRPDSLRRAESGPPKRALCGRQSRPLSTRNQPPAGTSTPGAGLDASIWITRDVRHRTNYVATTSPRECRWSSTKAGASPGRLMIFSRGVCAEWVERMHGAAAHVRQTRCSGTTPSRGIAGRDGR